MPYAPRPRPSAAPPSFRATAWLVEGDYRLSWSAFEDRVARLAGGLAARGVAPGDRVAMVSHNSARYVEFFYACFWAGAVAVPSNTRAGRGRSWPMPWRIRARRWSAPMAITPPEWTRCGTPAV